MDLSLDPKTFANDPLETLTEIKTQLSGRFQGINASYEALYQELHETRRRQGVLIDLVEKMHKTLQNTPNTNGMLGFLLLSSRQFD
jgi:predicted phage-related endonuclease